MLRNITVVLLPMLLVCGCSAVRSAGAGVPDGGAGATTRHTLTVDGRERSYLVHVPDGAEGSLPVVFVLHGGGGNGRQVEQQTGMAAAADEAGFVVVYPEGSGRTALLTWNAGNCCGYASREPFDDVTFVSEVLDQVLADYPADPERVFATGISNGAMMAYRLACELSDRIAAIAPVAGALNVDPCTPADPVSVLAVHGTADRVVPYDGGPPTRSIPGTDPWVNTSVEESISFWAAHNRCQGPPRQNRDGAVTVTIHTGCVDGTEVVLSTVDGGQHAWPGGAAPRAQADPVPPQPEATKVILDFFARVPAR